MSTSYSINIAMDQATLDGMQGAGFNLFAFKAVQGPANGQPLVWFQTNVFALSTTLGWSEQYEAYSSETVITNGVTIDASNHYPVSLGDVFAITGNTGDGTITTGGPSALAVEIDNQTSTQFTVGLSQVVTGQSNPMCAFPLFGSVDDVIIPVEKVMVMFATKTINTGAVIMTSFSQGVLIDLTLNNSVNVGYALNKGWQTLGNPAVTIVPEGTALNELLVLPAPDSAKPAKKPASVV